MSSRLLVRLAVLALRALERWPLLALLATVPAVLYPGAIVPAIIGLYVVSSRHRDWWVLAGCGPLAAVGFVFPMSEFAPSIWDSYTLLGIVYASMIALAPILLGQFLRSRRELALRLEEVKEAREHQRRLDAEAVLAKERNQLAREMHDVVSHQVSLIAVQAAARQVSTTDPDARLAARNPRSPTSNAPSPAPRSTLSWSAFRYVHPQAKARQVRHSPRAGTCCATERSTRTSGCSRTSSRC